MALDDEAVFHKFCEDLEEDARKLGLYTVHAQGHRRPIGYEGPERPLVYLKFLIGDEAFSDRVQHPELYSDEAALAGMEHGLYESEAEEIMRRYQETGKLFAGEDDEDE